MMKEWNESQQDIYADMTAWLTNFELIPSLPESVIPFSIKQKG
jgi:hypothetical protein